MDPQVASKVPFALPAEAYEEHRGKWVALSADGTSIIASAESLSALEDKLAAAGEDAEKVIFDQVEDEAIVCFSNAPIPYRILGYAGCLQFFNVTFRGADRITEIEPNQSCPGMIT
jgi:hypothetical protein